MGNGWLRTFPGGLLTTCGLRNVGSPQDTGGEHLGQHGRITASPASNVSVTGEWERDRFVSRVSGTVREAAVAGEHLELRREVTVAGRTAVQVGDVIRNCGFRDELVLVLYHCNLGWPLVDEGAELELEVADLP